jgi:hypothetical protein
VDGVARRLVVGLVEGGMVMVMVMVMVMGMGMGFGGLGGGCRDASGRETRRCCGMRDSAMR